MRTIPLLGLLAGLGFPGLAEDWPQFRGPDRNHVAIGLEAPARMPSGGWEVRWRQPVSYGWASPVVAGGRVYVFDADLRKPLVRERVHCFDETSGDLLWTADAPAPYPEWVFVEAQRSGPSATPIVEAGRLYCLGACGKVRCLDAGDGSLLWERDLAAEFEIPPMQCRASPLIEGSLLILLAGGKPDACLIALDKESGALAWHALGDEVSNSSPLIVEAGGSRQLVAWTGDSVSAVEPGSGRLLWRIAMKTSNNDDIATPVSDGDRLLVSGLMLEMSGPPPSATRIWPESLAVSRRLLSNTCTPFLRDDFVYGARSRGELVCLRADTGASLWETDEVTELKSGASVHLFPAGGDRFFLFNDQGELILAELSPAGYREIGRSPILEPTSPFAGFRAWVPPAFANGNVFARNDREVVCIRLPGNP